MAMHLFPFRIKLPNRASHLRSTQASGGAPGKLRRRLPPLRSPFWPAAIGGSLILLTLVVLSDSSRGQVTYTMPFVASEDTYVKSTRPNNNYGQETTLEADMQPSVKRALVRFSVTGIPSNATIESAMLRLFVVDRSNQSGSVHRVNGAWDEASTKWSNAPAVGQQVAMFSGAAVQGTWKGTNVVSAVTGNGRVDFYIVTGSTDGVDYSSSENPQYKPTLVVRWSVPTAGPSPTAQPTPTPTAGTPGPTSPPTPIAGVGTTFYVDSAAGNDSNNGTGEATAWRTVSKVSNATLAAGDRVLFKRGGVWAGPLTLSKAGTADRPITIGSYGSGALPVIQGPGNCVDVKGTRLIVTQLNVKDCAWAGIRISPGATFNRIDGNLITGNVAGVHVTSGASDNFVIGNTLQNNNKMSVNTPGGDDDSGAFGVLLNGDRTEVANNAISGSDAFSYDYGRDGAAVEVYGGLGNNVHHNFAVDNDAFTELGNSRSRDNTFDYNVVRSSLDKSIFVVTRGASSGFGPVANTKLLNNTVVLTGANSQGFVCHAGCNSSVLVMRNNVIQAVLKAGYADGAFDEDYDIFGGTTQFPLGPNSRVADPMFNNAGAGDFHLAAASPAVDTGVNVGLTADFEGGHVPHDGNGDGVVAADRGAYERGSTGAATPPPTTRPTATATTAPTAAPPTPPPPTPAPPAGGDAVLVGAGDIASCGGSGDEATANLLDNIPGTVFTLGDSVYEDGTPQQFADCYSPSWGRHVGRTRPAPGNHDYHQSGAPGYYGFFGDAATPLQPGCRSGCNGYYSYNAGSWHVIVLNSECATEYNACDEAAMLAWLDQDLRANPAACTLAMWHRPVLTIGPHNIDEGNMRPFWQKLYDFNADLVINGHDHSYARYAQLNRDANGTDGARGIRQIVAGTGGKGLTTSTRAGSTPGLEAWQDASTANALGVLKLTLHAGSYDWQFVPVAGKTFTDSGSGSCH
jgi:parallel beta-helix repeat protein